MPINVTTGRREQMRILFVGWLNEGQTSRMRMEALEQLGHSVIGINEQEEWATTSWLSRRTQRWMEGGPVISRLNRRILRVATEWKPDLVWAEKQELIQPETLARLRKQGVRSLHFTPDPYFTLAWKRTRAMADAFPLYDYLVTSKRYELEAYERLGPQVIYVALGFAEWVHRPLSPATSATREQFSTDVGFIGGWEPRRQQMLEAVAATGSQLKIWGYSWDHLRDGRWTPRRAYRLRTNAGKESFSFARSPRLGAALQGGEIYGDAYAWALSGAKISLGFLRQICPDQHTTRTFEIPACGSMLLADRTSEHQEFFAEGSEADFFSSTDELVDKTKFYLANENARATIARRGYERCFASGYSYTNRVNGIIAALG